MMSSCYVMHSHCDVTCHIIKITPISKEFGQILKFLTMQKISNFLQCFAAPLFFNSTRMPMCLVLAFSMGKRGPQPKSAKPQAPTRLPPHGKKDGNLRTPKHIVDPAGGKDMYNVQDIIAER